MVWPRAFRAVICSRYLHHIEQNFKYYISQLRAVSSWLVFLKLSRKCIPKPFLFRLPVALHLACRGLFFFYFPFRVQIPPFERCYFASTSLFYFAVQPCWIFCFAGIFFLFACLLFKCLFVARLFSTSDCSPNEVESAVTQNTQQRTDSCTAILGLSITKHTLFFAVNYVYKM